jgi:hypothetical protein
MDTLPQISHISLYSFLSHLTYLEKLGTEQVPNKYSLGHELLIWYLSRKSNFLMKLLDACGIC